MVSSPLQDEIDARNTLFWSELCGTSIAKSLGIVETTPKNLVRYDRAYMEFYPYLSNYVLRESLNRKSVLEIGLGYGSLGQLIAEQGAIYFGLDIAPMPVKMMQYRLQGIGQDTTNNIQEGSALAIPHPSETFDYVYSIGCLHHTGNLPQAVREVFRVLKPNGKAIIMLYNKHSFRQFRISLKMMVSAKASPYYGEEVRAAYDTNAAGEAAPHTDFVSYRDIKKLFAEFSSFKADCQNFNDCSLFRDRIVLRREVFLNNIARILGLDWYIVAQK